MEAEIVVAMPTWLADSLLEIAEICEKTVDDVAASFFAAEVVHTQAEKAD